MATSNCRVDAYLEGFEIQSIRDWLWNHRAAFSHPTIDLAMVFVSPDFAEHSGLLLSLIHDEINPKQVIGCSSPSLVSNDRELENTSGFTIGLFHLPDTVLKTIRFDQREIEHADSSSYWRDRLSTGSSNGWIVFADPFHMNLDTWLKQWNQALPGIPILGGLASGRPGVHQTELYLQDQVFTQGGVGLCLEGKTRIQNVISQGCTPIGEPWIITKSSDNVLEEIGNRPAYQVLLETVNELPKNLVQEVQGNLFLGLVTNEYAEDFNRGDFLVRNLLGADPDSGRLSVGALPRLGQTVQFQLRSPNAADEDLKSLLREARLKTKTERVLGGLLCTCNGRGQRLFGAPHHDAQEIINAFGSIGLIGFFCNGELGPVGNQNYLHGYTASLALFTAPAD